MLASSINSSVALTTAEGGSRVRNHGRISTYDDITIVRTALEQRKVDVRERDTEQSGIDAATLIRKSGQDDHLPTGASSRHLGSAGLRPASPTRPYGWCRRPVAEKPEAVVLSSDDTEWTKSEVIRDPQGAELTLSQLAPPDN